MSDVDREAIELGIASIGEFDIDNCTCDPSVGVYPCHYCAEREAIVAGKRVLQRLAAAEAERDDAVQLNNEFITKLQSALDSTTCWSESPVELVTYLIDERDELASRIQEDLASGICPVCRQPEGDHELKCSWGMEIDELNGQLDDLTARLAAAEAARDIAEQQLTVICEGVNRRCGADNNQLPLVSLDRLLAAHARDRINLVAWMLRSMDQFGCFSGDCPHWENSGCIQSIIDEYVTEEAKGGRDERNM